MKSTSVKIAAVIFTVIFLVQYLLPLTAGAETLTSDEIYVRVNGADFVSAVATFETEYADDTYVSMKGLAAALKDTEKRFNIERLDGMWCITTGVQCSWQTRGASPGYAIYAEVALLQFVVDGAERRYYGYSAEDDLFLSVTDTQLLLDMYMPYEGGLYVFYPEETFHADLYLLSKQGFMDYLNAAMLADLSTGEVFFAVNDSDTVPLASTSKLMTFYLLAEAIENGTASLSDTAVVSAAAAALSSTTSSHEYMYEGQRIPVSELVSAMLVESSNESAFVLAEYLAGSEEAFVELMNAKAKELRLSSAKFFNSHGVSVVVKETVPVKTENKMSVKDMFKLVLDLVRRFPWVFDITSQKTAYLPSFDHTAQTTNVLLYNMDNIVGLKTGTTPMAGKCLIAVAETQIQGETHYIAAFVYGAMDETERFSMTELLLKSRMWERWYR